MLFIDSAYLMSTPSEQIKPQRIKSFIRRQGRLTPGQQHAIDTLWDRYCLNPDVNYDFSEVFGRTAPIIMEIGFGNGTSLVEMAEANPELDYIGLEVHTPGVGHILRLIQDKELNNIRLYNHDAVEVLENRIKDGTLTGLHLFFPDPWHKKKHHKRRIVRPDFVELLARKLRSGGYFHAATDWQHYAEDMLNVLSANSELTNTSETQDYCPRPDYRPQTKFEQRGIRLGHGVWDIIFTRK